MVVGFWITKTENGACSRKDVAYRRVSGDTYLVTLYAPHAATRADSAERVVPACQLRLTHVGMLITVAATVRLLNICASLLGVCRWWDA